MSASIHPIPVKPKPEPKRWTTATRREGPFDFDTLVHIPERTRKTFITSDFHLCHANIIRYCNRPYHIRGGNSNPANIPVVNQMNEDILALFDRLPLDCDVWNLGDVFYPLDRRLSVSQISSLKSMVRKMKGEGGNRRLFLVLGNHDIGQLRGHARAEFYEMLGFDEVYDAPVIIEDKYLLSHEPVYLKKGSPLINLYGHLHEKLLQKNDFCIDYEKYRRQIQIAEREGREKPKLEISWPEREIDLANYRTMCLDYNRGILEWTGDSFTVAAPIWTD